MKRKFGILRWSMFAFGVTIGIALAEPSAAQTTVTIGKNCFEDRYASESTCNANFMADCQDAAKNNDCGINPPSGQIFKPNSFSGCTRDPSYVKDYLSTCVGTYEPPPQPQCTVAAIPQGSWQNCPAACTADCGFDYCGWQGGYCSGGPQTTCFVGAAPYCECGTPTCNCTGPNC